MTFQADLFFCDIQHSADETFCQPLVVEIHRRPWIDLDRPIDQPNRLVIPPRLGLVLEFCVAVMLILLGMLTLSGRRVGSASNLARPLVVGIVHGLAGSAFVALLVLAAVPGAMLQLLYLALFATGTIAGMALITIVVALPSAVTARRFVSTQRYLRLASGLASLVFGVVLVQRGVSQGLFDALPHWTPQ